MEYVYAAMLLHKAGQKVDDARVKALVAALEGVNIDEAIEKASVAQVAVAAAPATTAEHKADARADSAKKAAEEKKAEESAAAGLGALFG